MNILVLNCGSSSLKFQLIDSETENVLAKGICERIGIDGKISYTPYNGKKKLFLKICRHIPRLSVMYLKHL